MAPPENEPLVLVNLFSLGSGMVDEFVATWETAIADSTGAPGFRGTRLHRAIDPSSPYQVVDIARWESEDHWRAAVAAAGWDDSGETPEDSPVRARPALYRVVHVTPDPQEGTADDACRG